MSEEQAAAGAAGAASGGAAGGLSEEFSFVYDIPVTLRVEMGEATLSIGDLLKCTKGSVIPLNQKVGDPFKIYLRQKPLAEGEIVQAGDHLGIKITTVLKAS